MNFRAISRKILGRAALVVALGGRLAAQSPAPAGDPDGVVVPESPPAASAAAARYLDPDGGLAADDAVRRALDGNGEIVALRREADAARALVRQAGLRANPRVEARGQKQLGGPDSQVMVEGMLPLELGGRRAARVRVAEAELALRELALANEERLLAAEVRGKFGESLAAVKKLELVERILANAARGYEQIAARVREGRTAPLEANQLVVELNRLRSLRETAEGRVEAAFFELRNLLGARPEEPLRLRGDFGDLIAPPAALDAALAAALRTRPDLEGARATERLAAARLERARADARPDASLKTGYQRMASGYPLNGIDEAGALRPIDSVFQFFTFGVEIDLPVRNRNQGEIEAALFEQQAAASRIRFGELTVRRELSAAYARYARAARALAIFENGVRDQASANLRVVWQTYELGRNTLSEYIAEERRALDIENELVDAALETYAARLEILKAANAPELIKK